MVGQPTLSRLEQAAFAAGCIHGVLLRQHGSARAGLLHVTGYGKGCCHECSGCVVRVVHHAVVHKVGQAQNAADGVPRAVVLVDSCLHWSCLVKIFAASHLTVIVFGAQQLPCAAAPMG